MLFCHSLPCFIFFFFYQDHSFTQLIQVFMFKNKPDISFVHYKLEIYIVGVKISGNLKKKHVHLQDPNFIWNQGARFKASGNFLLYFFSSCPTKMYVPVYISYRPMVISRANKIYEY